MSGGLLTGRADRAAIEKKDPLLQKHSHFVASQPEMKPKEKTVLFTHCNLQYQTRKRKQRGSPESFFFFKTSSKELLSDLIPASSLFRCSSTNAPHLHSATFAHSPIQKCPGPVTLDGDLFHSLSPGCRSGGWLQAMQGF